jgi:DNA-binding MarR family transcriptional regulator
MYCCAVTSEDIGTPPPRLLERTGFLLAQAADRAAPKLDEALRPLGIKRRHYGVLVALADKPGSSQQALADRLGIDRTTMAKIVDDLEGLGLVRRSRHPKSRRANALEATSAGSRLMPRVLKAATQADDQLLASLSPAQRDQLRQLLLNVIAPDQAASIRKRSRAK